MNVPVITNLSRFLSFYCLSTSLSSSLSFFLTCLILLYKENVVIFYVVLFLSLFCQNWKKRTWENMWRKKKKIRTEEWSNQLKNEKKTNKSKMSMQRIHDEQQRKREWMRVSSFNMGGDVFVSVYVWNELGCFCYLRHDGPCISNIVSEWASKRMSEWVRKIRVSMETSHVHRHEHIENQPHWWCDCIFKYHGIT